MRPLKQRTLVILIGIGLIILIPYIVYLCRRPVLIVTDMAFIPLYGKERIRQESRAAALSLYRRVKSVIISDDAEDSVVPHAVNEASSRPHCVIFPGRFARSARLYREQKPHIPIIVLEGRAEEGSIPSLELLGGQAQDYFIYKTDIDTDFYTAGIAAMILEQDRTELEVEGKGRIVIFFESKIQKQVRESIFKALNTQENPPDISFYTSFTQLISHNNITCSIMTGTGIQFFEKYQKIPVILFTWANPEVIPEDVALVFNDSPWAQLLQAVRMSEKGVQEGVIPSKIIYKNTQKINKRLLRKNLN